MSSSLASFLPVECPSLTNLCTFWGWFYLWCSRDNQRCRLHLWAAEPMVGVANTFHSAGFTDSAHSSSHLLPPVLHGERCDQIPGRWVCHSFYSFLACHLVMPPSSFLSTKPRCCPVPAPDSAWCSHSLLSPRSCALSPPHQVLLPHHRGSQAGHTVSLNLKCPQGTVLWPQSLVEYSFDFILFIYFFKGRSVGVVLGGGGGGN